MSTPPDTTLWPKLHEDLMSGTTNPDWAVSGGYTRRNVYEASIETGAQVKVTHLFKEETTPDGVARLYMGIATNFLRFVVPSSLYGVPLSKLSFTVEASSGVAERNYDVVMMQGALDLHTMTLDTILNSVPTISHRKELAGIGWQTADFQDEEDIIILNPTDEVGPWYLYLAVIPRAQADWKPLTDTVESEEEDYVALSPYLCMITGFAIDVKAVLDGGDLVTSIVYTPTPDDEGAASPTNTDFSLVYHRDTILAEPPAGAEKVELDAPDTVDRGELPDALFMGWTDGEDEPLTGENVLEITDPGFHIAKAVYTDIQINRDRWGNNGTNRSKDTEEEPSDSEVDAFVTEVVLPVYEDVYMYAGTASGSPNTARTRTRYDIFDKDWQPGWRLRIWIGMGAYRYNTSSVSGAQVKAARMVSTLTGTVLEWNPVQFRFYTTDDGSTSGQIQVSAARLLEGGLSNSLSSLIPVDITLKDYLYIYCFMDTPRRYGWREDIDEQTISTQLRIG